MSWWKRLSQRRKMEEQLEKELSFHVERHTSDLIARGGDPGEARRQARLVLGGPEQVKEKCRDARGTRWLEDVWQDFRYALRTLRQKPGFAVVALSTLALGAGATTVMFTVVNGVLLKPLAYPQPERLVTLHEQTQKYGAWSLAYLNFLDCKRESRSFVSMEAWRNGSGTVSEPGDAEYVLGRQISSGLFSTLGVDLVRGRPFLPEEDRSGAAPVAIIGDHLWQRRFSGNPGAIGARLVFDAKVYTVVGIAPPNFRLSGDADVFTPLGQDTEPTMQDRAMHPDIHVVARLRPGVTPAQAQAELSLIGHRLAEQYPKSNAGHDIAAQPLQQELVGDVRSTLWLLLGAVSLVLLIACVNIASLMLARAVSRERELAMRVALGAGRGRLLRQCLTESAVLALFGGLLGIVLAKLGTRPFLEFWPGSLPRAEEVHIDWRVLLFALCASLLCGLLFGVAPALRAPARDLEQALRAGARTVSGGSRRLHSGFVISEIALAVVLLVAAGMLGRTLLRLSSVATGMDVHNVLVTRVALSSEAVADPARIRVAWQDIQERVSRVPGVQSAAVADTVPMSGDNDEIGYWTAPAMPPANEMPLALMNLATPEYLKVLGMPLLRGRFFNDHDRIGNQPVVVIDEALAQRAFGDRDAVGNRLSLQFLGSVRVVGVVGHVRFWGFDVDEGAKVREQLYLPLAQLPEPFLRLTAAGMSLIVRTQIPPLTALEAIRAKARGGARDQVLYDVRTMEQIVSATLARQRFLLLLFGIFSGLALLLASIGIYGVLAYLTSRRVPEIGVRMALGASSGNVMRLVLRQSIGMIFLGIGVGLGAAWGAGRLLERSVAGMRGDEPLTFAIMTSVLAIAAFFASFIPARRASRVDPVTALRQE
ncbi:MAG: ABC transporter permease [Bryobacteraceae bacterium]